jgi:hypothetical protein
VNQGEAQAVGAEDGSPRAPRTALLLAATIDHTGRRHPVRIRNLSEGGALIEGSGLPAPGTPLVIRRHQHHVGATLVWRDGDRAGLRFDRRIVAVDWAGGLRPRNGSAVGQAQVDAMQAAIRLGVSVTAPPATTPPPLDDLDRRIAGEIEEIASLIGRIGDALADDAAMVERHAATLQQFDLVTQVLNHLAAVVAAEDRAAAVTAIGMADLRARLGSSRRD